MNRKDAQDSRIKAHHFSWLEFAITFFVLSVLTAGQALILSAYVDYHQVPIDYALGMLGYWAIVAGVFSLLTHFQIRRKFDDPMRRLSVAAKQVAAGDFSVFLEPVHTADRVDYIDVMFEDFNKMVEELGSTETMKNDFIANVSHEIKTPLAIIQNYAAALQKEDLSAAQRREYADTIATASENLSALVTNILRLNKLEHQQIVATPQRYDLCRQLSECALRFEDVWERQGIAFSADIEDRALIRANASMMEIVWNNLLSNAFKFTEQGGSVELKQTSEHNTVTVSVSDTGCGMNQETMKHIFDKFYQGDTSHSSEGNGLGLALAKRVIELSGGTIAVKSAPGKGATFLVTLPADG